MSNYNRTSMQVYIFNYMLDVRGMDDAECGRKISETLHITGGENIGARKPGVGRTTEGYNGSR